MWSIYGTVSLLFGMLMFLGLKFMDTSHADTVDYFVIIALGLICVFAGLDWLNLIPEV